MAALFLVMIGTSLLLLRGKSARTPMAAEVTVTEQGTPAPAASAPLARVMETMQPPQAPSPVMLATSATVEAKPPAVAFAIPPKESPPSATAGSGGGPAGAMHPSPDWSQSAADQRNERAPDDQLFDEALRNYRAGRFTDAAREFDALPASNPNAPDLWAARAVRDGKGCRAAVSRFDKTALRDRQAPSGWDALLEGALCYRALGDFATARARLTALLGVDSHKDRARAELERIDQLQQAQASREAAQVAAAKSAARSRTLSAVPAAAPLPTPSAQTPTGAATPGAVERP
jgi:hypothetical protein